MPGKWQFSLGYLFTELTLIAVVMGIGCWRLGSSQRDAVIGAFLVIPFMVCLCAAIGGLINRMRRGVIVGLVVGFFLFVPSLIVALTGGV